MHEPDTEKSAPSLIDEWQGWDEPQTEAVVPERSADLIDSWLDEAPEASHSPVGSRPMDDAAWMDAFDDQSEAPDSGAVPPMRRNKGGRPKGTTLHASMVRRILQDENPR